MIFRSLTLMSVFATFFILAACSDSETTDERPTLPIPAADEGIQFSFEYTVPAATEAWKCAVYSVPSDDFSYINSVESISNDGMHHMTLGTMGFTGPQFEDGVYDCEELLMENMTDLILFFGNQGGTNNFALPEGVVATIPPGIKVIHELHYVNPTEEPVDIYSYVNGYYITQDEITDGIWGGQIRDETLDVKDGEDSVEWTRCVMNEAVDVLFIGSHTHKLGVEFTVAKFDGENTGEVFYRNTDWHDPKIVQFEEPIRLEVGEGFEYQCTFRNNTGADVAYGSTAEDEMCNLTIVHTPDSQSAQCEVVETSDGVLWSKN